MNFEELVAELRARGFDYLSTTRCMSYLNDAYLLDICETEDWPFLEATATGTAPLKITSLRSIESVIDSTQKVKLKPLDRRALSDFYDTDLSTVGSPLFYYLSGETTVSVYPANTTDTLQVRYWTAPSALSGTEEPLLPDRFHSLIADAAVARAYEDSDDYELAQNARENFEARLARMKESLMGQIRDMPNEFVVSVDPGTEA